MSESPSIDTVFDDDQQYIGKVYAKALLAAAAKQNVAEEVIGQMQSIVVDVFQSSPKLEALFSNPRIEVARKIGLIDSIFKGKVHDCLLRFLKIVASRRRMDSLRSIANSALSMQDEATGKLQVQVTTAQALDSQQLDQLHHKLQVALSAEVRLSTKVNPSILGGLIVRIGDTLYDSSVDGRLKQLQRAAKVRAESTIRGKADQLTS